MRVAFDASVLADESHAAELIAIAALAALRGSPHRLVTDVDALSAWAKQAAPAVAEWLEVVAELGVEADSGAGRRMETTLTVADAPATSSSTAGYAWTLPPAEALAVLRRPFRLVVENSVGDVAFLLAFAPEDVCDDLKAWFDADWVMPHGVGGNAEVLKQAERACKDGAHAIRSWFLMDSDRLKDGPPSATAAEFQRKLKKLESDHRLNAGAAGHVLHARSIECYAPPDDLLRWALTQVLDGARPNAIIEFAQGPGKRPKRLTASEKRLLFAATWRELPWTARRVLSVKDGADAAKNDEAVLAGLGARQGNLLPGLGSAFAVEYYSGRSGLRHETGELLEMITLLMGRI